VTVEQDGAVATSRASTTVTAGQDHDWRLDLHTGSQLTAGAAEAYALAIVHRSDGSSYQYPWEDHVQLRP
jgi:hypothetical protein